jgi:hypothetical protein
MFRARPRAVVSFICLLGCAFSALAAQTTIGILPFQSAPGVPVDGSLSVEQFVYSAMTSQERFRVLERARVDALFSERNYQQAQEVVNPAALRDLGAQFVLAGEVTRVDIARVQSNGITNYRATIAFGIRIIEVSTGSVVGSEEFSSSRGNPLATVFAGLTGDPATPAGALDIALQQNRKQFERFVRSVFAATGQLVSIEQSDRKGMPASVLISLGSADGIERKSVLAAYFTELITVGDRQLERKHSLAELSFAEAQGDHLSLFKVRKGADRLRRALDEGRTVVVEFIQ